jgi:hypothetical protein
MRLQTALRATLPPLGRSLAWCFFSREHTNFTYDLTELNHRYLTAFVAEVTRQDYSVIEGYTREIREDQAFQNHVLRLTAQSKYRHVADPGVRLARRIGWYALIRAAKPRVTVETGIDKGLGTCVIAAALKRNTAEGHPGQVIGLDLDPTAGYLFQEPYAKFGRVIYGDSHQTIPALTETVDFFIQDSDHAPAHEAAEFRLIAPKLSANALVLSDNADTTDELLKFALTTAREFLYFGEVTANHWLQGSGLGVARPQSPRSFSKEIVLPR